MPKRPAEAADSDGSKKSEQQKFLRNFVIVLLAAYALFDLSIRIHPSPFSDYLIATLQVGFNYPDPNSMLAPLGVSPREAEIVDLILRGLSNKEIAARLFISVETVKKHSYNGYRKLGVKNRVQLSYFVQNRPECAQKDER